MGYLSGGGCPPGTTDWGSGCYANEGSTCYTGCPGGGSCGGAGSCNCSSGGGGGGVAYECNDGSCSSGNCNIADANCFSAEADCINSCTSARCCTSGGCQDHDETTCNDWGYVYYIDAATCSMSCGDGNGGSNGDQDPNWCCNGGDQCTQLATINETCNDGSVGYDGQSECNNNCSPNTDSYCCRSDGTCYTGQGCSTGEDEFETNAECTATCQPSIIGHCCVAGAGNTTVCTAVQNTNNCLGSVSVASNCNNTCGTTNNCGNVTEPCVNRVVGLGEYCGPTGECCDNGNLTYKGDNCADGLRCETGSNPYGVCVDTCGDGVEDPGEDCDDGNTSNNDACTNTCESAYCGDGFVETGSEDCDDGNSIDNDGCDSNCQPSAVTPSCGNGIQEGSEECDNGSSNSDTAADACRTDCTDATCGDGVTDNGEECDDGNQIDDDSCKNDCTEPTVTTGGCGSVTEECNDEIVGLGQACFHKGECCNANDEVISHGVSCEQGLECAQGFCADPCGNGRVDTGEECDDGNTDDTDDCKNDCTEPVADSSCGRCGDSCEDLNSVSNCPRSTLGVVVLCEEINGVCQRTNANVCGNGQREGSEQCDTALANSDTMPNACRTDCQNPSCGDGVVDNGEACDDGTSNSDSTADTCRTSCTEATCGDGVRDSAEECDDGNTDDTDDCLNNCTVPRVCDVCGPNCMEMIKPCRDGLPCPGCAEPQEGLTCGYIDGVCSALEQEELCGNGQIDEGEECDGALTDACSGSEVCGPTCTCDWGDVNVCGNDPDTCCLPGNVKLCCQQHGSSPLNTATLCWPVGQTPPVEACDAIDPAFTCASCAGQSDCRPGERCIEGSCKRLTHSATWEPQGEPELLGGAIDHSTVDMNGTLWNVYQDQQSIFSQTRIASFAGSTWNDTQTVLSGLPSLDEFTHVVFSGSQWLIGGTDYKGAPRRTRDVWSSPDGINWARHPNALPTEIDRHASVVFEGKMWIFGGSQGSKHASTTIFVSHDGKTWTRAGALPFAIAHAEAVVQGESVLLIGGTDEEGNASQQLWKSSNGIAWSQVGSNVLSTLDISEYTATVFEETIWLVGKSNSGAANALFSYDGGATWNQGPRPETGVFRGTDTVVFGDALWLVGGHRAQSGGANTVYSLAMVPSNSCNPIRFFNPFFCPEDKNAPPPDFCGNGTCEAGEDEEICTSCQEGGNCSCTVACPEDCESSDNNGDTATTGTTGGTVGTTETGGGDTAAQGGTNGTENTTGTTGTVGGTTGGSTGGSFARASCGDGLVQGREACDDGNNRNGDGCSSSCEIESPQQRRAAREQLAQQAQEQERTLRLLARDKACGNGLVQAPEQCDDGNKADGDGCSSSCRLEPRLVASAAPECGDGVQDSGEECDDGPENSDSIRNACRTDCKKSYCGDFVLDRDEQCDNGPANSDTDADACRTVCTLPQCGDGVVDTTEECDDGNVQNEDGCSSRCTAEEALFAAASVCGDGIKHETEECDDSNRRDGDGCNSTCLLEIGICGDGIVQQLLGEECENATHAADLPYSCVECLYLSETCGDGTVDPGEQCDLAAANSNEPNARCRTNCHMSRCGDGITDVPDEECDDGNRINGDLCDWLCKKETLALNGSIEFGSPELETEEGRAAALQQRAYNTTQAEYFPQYASYQPLGYQLPLAQLQPLIQQRNPMGDTGPAAVAIAGAGAAAGISWIRRRRK